MKPKDMVRGAGFTLPMYEELEERIAILEADGIVNASELAQEMVEERAHRELIEYNRRRFPEGWKSYKD